MNRHEAIAAGAVRYQGRPCRLGHTERYRANGNCVPCLLAQPITDKKRASIAAYAKAHRHEPLKMLAARCRARVRAAIQRGGFAAKARLTSEMVGCDWPTLKAHIESQFAYAMGWHNSHLWQIDHRTPLARATTEDELLKLCHYTNLQPLWRWVNHRKGAR